MYLLRLIRFSNFSIYILKKKSKEIPFIAAEGLCQKQFLPTTNAPVHRHLSDVGQTSPPKFTWKFMTGATEAVTVFKTITVNTFMLVI